MPLGNGQERSLSDVTRDAGAQSIRVQPLPQQPGLRTGLSPLTRGLRGEFTQYEPDVVPAPIQPRGIMDGFVKTCQRWGLSRKEQLILLGYSGDSASLGMQLLQGLLLSPPQDVKDRTGYVLGISIGLGAIFGEVAHAEVTWLRNPHPKLHDTSPLDLMLNGKMTSLMIVARLVAEERELE
jgi:Antitoxin Xre/MbcA/ParS C-terminal toxin-binding domain